LQRFLINIDGADYYQRETITKNFIRELSMYEKGDKILQMVIMPYPKIEPEWADELSDTPRGSGGFGSTGK